MHDAGCVPLNSRRKFLKAASSLVTGASLHAVSGSTAYASVKSSKRPVLPTQSISLEGIWEFRLDPDKSGEVNNWQSPSNSSNGWRQLSVPHSAFTRLDAIDRVHHGWRKSLLSFIFVGAILSMSR